MTSGRTRTSPERAAGRRAEAARPAGSPAGSRRSRAPSPRSTTSNTPDTPTSATRSRRTTTTGHRTLRDDQRVVVAEAQAAQQLVVGRPVEERHRDRDSREHPHGRASVLAEEARELVSEEPGGHNEHDRESGRVRRASCRAAPPTAATSRSRSRAPPSATRRTPRMKRPRGSSCRSPRAGHDRSARATVATRTEATNPINTVAT